MSKGYHISGTIASDIGFYVGDICYALPPDVYDGVYGKNNFAPGVYDTDDGSFAVGDTAYGDGSYMGEDDCEYYVDAGNIGIVPIELLHCEEDELVEGCRVVSVPGEADFDFEDGVFWVSLPNGEEYYINTRD